MPLRLLALLLAGVVAQAQTTSQGVFEKDPCDQAAERAGRPAVSVFQNSYYHVLPRGKQENIAVVLCVGEKWGGCRFTEKPNQAGLVPLALELQPEEGLTVRYLAGRHYQPQTGKSLMQVNPGQKIILLKVRATRDLSLGAHDLKGRLIFKTVREGKQSTPQEIDVKIPITVVEHTAKVVKSEWPFGSQVGHNVRAVLLLPVEIPAGILLFLACGIGKGCDL